MIQLYDSRKMRLDGIYAKVSGKVERKEFDKLIQEKLDAMGGLCDEVTAAVLVAHDVETEG